MAVAYRALAEFRMTGQEYPAFLLELQLPVVRVSTIKR